VSEGAGAAAVLDSIRPARPTARSEAITTKASTQARYRPLRTGLEFDAAVRSAGVCVASLLIVWTSRSRDLRETWRNKRCGGSPCRHSYGIVLLGSW